MSKNRLFIALYPDETSLDSLSLIDKVITPLAGLRIIPRNQRHLTLCFLGEVDDFRTPTIKKVLTSLSSKDLASQMIFDQLAYGASPTHPNLIWLKGQNVSWLLSLWQYFKKELAVTLPLTAFDEQGQKSLTSNQFLSHLTLARFKSLGNVNLPDLPTIAPLSINFKSLVLIRSVLTPQGPVYDCLEEIFFKI